MNSRTGKTTAAIPQKSRVTAVEGFFRLQLVFLELAAIGVGLDHLQKADAGTQTFVAILLFMLAIFTLFTGKGFPHFRHRGKALLIAMLAGFFVMSGATLWHDEREVRLANLRETDPVAYLSELHKIDEHRWFGELKELDPDAYRDEAARRAAAADAQRAAQCTDKKVALAYVMIQTDVRNGLRAPSTAKFPSRFNKGTRHLGDCVYQVYGQFDAQNGFGAMLRGTFSGTIRYFPEREQWRTETLDIQG